MNHGFRTDRTSSFTKSPSLVGVASIVGLSALLVGSSLVVGCGGGDSGSDGGGGQSGSAGSGGKATTTGGSQATGDAGAMTGVSGTKNSAGTPNDGGAPSTGGTANSNGGDDAGNAGGAPENPGTGSDGLGTADGITGTFEGAVHAHTFNPAQIPQQSKTVVIGATSAMYPLYNAWGMRFLPKLGVQACTGDTGTEDTFITFGSQTDFKLGGTTAKGSCSINVTSLGPKLEGSFIATLATEHGQVEVTDGYFRVPGGVK